MWFLRDDLSRASSEYHVQNSVVAFMTLSRTDYDRHVSKSYDGCRNSMPAKVMKMSNYTSDACQSVKIQIVAFGEYVINFSMECYYQWILRNCSCIPPLDPSEVLLSGVRTCISYAERKCWQKANLQENVECQDQCLPACAETSYDVGAVYQD